MENSQGEKRESHFGLSIPYWNIQYGIHNTKDHS
jgi:hypothetical protein